MATEWREEICPDCGAERERVWITQCIPKKVAVPRGYHVEKSRSNSAWKHIAGPTSDVTLCMCDAI